MHFDIIMGPVKPWKASSLGEQVYIPFHSIYIFCPEMCTAYFDVYPSALTKEESPGIQKYDAIDK